MTNATTPEFDIDEWNSIANTLGKFHCVFYRFWGMGYPVYSDSVKTAAVAFDRNGQFIEFKINYEFWQKLTPNQRLFIICHECLHVIFNHGKRAKLLFSTLTPEDRYLLNVAMDICVNHALVTRFDFNRSEIDPENMYIWADKVGGEIGMPDLAPDRCFEYYYNLLKTQTMQMDIPPPSGSGSGAFGDTADDHDGDQSKSDEAGDAVIEKMAEAMDEGERDALENIVEEQHTTRTSDAQDPQNGVMPGDVGLGALHILKEVKVQPKPKWENVIKKWIRLRFKEENVDTEQWAKMDRRFVMLDPGLSLPSNADQDTIVAKKDRIDLWFFLDTSGSCIQLAGRFFKAAKSLPKDRFNVNLLCFDTAVYETDIKSRKVYGGGGTSFSIMEAYIQKHTVKKGLKYPDGVFVITDGYGNAVKPQRPEVWHWFLTKEMYTKHVPDKSRHYLLSNYE